MRPALAIAILAALIVPLSGAYAEYRLQIETFTIRILPNGRPGPKADLFNVGETIGVLTAYETVPAAYHLRGMLVRLNGRTGRPVNPPQDFDVGPDKQGKGNLARINELAPGDYELVILQIGADERYREVATHRFRVVGATGGLPGTFAERGPSKIARTPAVAGMNTGFLASPPAEPERLPPAAAVPASLGASGAIPAIALRPWRSPAGDISLAIPEGWRVQELPQADLGLVIKPRTGDEPSIAFTLLRISDARFVLILNRCARQFIANPLGSPDAVQCAVAAGRAQIGDSSHRWSAPEAARLTRQLLHTGNRSFTLTSERNLSPSQMLFRGDLAIAGRRLVDWGAVTMAYLPNSLLSPANGRPGVTSLELIEGCEALPAEEAQFRPVCAAVLRSFRPSSAWAARLAAKLAASYQQEFQQLLNVGYQAVWGFQQRSAMIGAFGQSMQQMQMQTSELFRSTNFHVGEDWIATFGGYVNLQDPASGKVYSAPYGSQSYGIDDRGPTPVILQGRDVAPGKSVGPYEVQRLLQPW